MRIFIAILLSIQFVTSPVAAELGEHKTYNPSKRLVDLMSHEEAKGFLQSVETQVETLIKLGAEGFLRTADSYSKDDKFQIENLIKASQGKKFPQFQEKAKGHWVASVDGRKVSFSLADIYKKQIVVEGRIVSFRDASITQIKDRVLEALAKNKTTMLKTMIDQIFISEAYAEPISGTILVMIAAVVAAVIGGLAWYNWKHKPEKAVQALKEVSKKLEADAASCDAAKTNSTDYDKTFDLASEVGGRTELNSLTTTDNALRYLIKEQITSGERQNADCYDMAHLVGKKIGIDIPLVSEQALLKMEMLGGDYKAVSSKDTKGALYNMCMSYNKLAGCMEQFIASHVNDSDVTSFKEEARRSHQNYQRKSGASDL
jgi:hypothetical protein